MYLITYASIFSIIFVGDFTVLNIPAYYFCYIFLIVVRISLGLRLKAPELFAQFFLSAILLPVTLYNSDDIMSMYYHSYIFCVLSVNAIPLVIRLISLAPRHSIFLTTQLVLLSCLSLYALFVAGNRGTFVFGPNVYYRIMGVSFALFIASQWSQLKIGKIIPAFLIYFLGVAATLSRGGLITFICVAFFVLVRSSFSVSAKKIISGIIVVLSLLYITSTLLSTQVFSRLIFINVDDITNADSSAGYRFSSLLKLMDFFSNERGWDILFGLGEMNGYFSFHPHNVFVESYLYGGLLTGVTATIFSLTIIICLFSRDTKIFLSSLFALPILVGSQFSGSFLESYFLFSFAAYRAFVVIYKYFDQDS